MSLCFLWRAGVSPVQAVPSASPRKDDPIAQGAHLTVTQEQRNVTQEKERRYDVRAPLLKKFFSAPSASRRWLASARLRPTAQSASQHPRATPHPQPSPSP